MPSNRKPRQGPPCPTLQASSHRADGRLSDLTAVQSTSKPARKRLLKIHLAPTRGQRGKARINKGRGWGGVGCKTQSGRAAWLTLAAEARGGGPRAAVACRHLEPARGVARLARSLVRVMAAAAVPHDGVAVRLGVAVSVPAPHTTTPRHHDTAPRHDEGGEGHHSNSVTCKVWAWDPGVGVATPHRCFGGCRLTRSSCSCRWRSRQRCRRLRP